MGLGHSHVHHPSLHCSCWLLPPFLDRILYLLELLAPCPTQPCPTCPPVGGLVLTSGIAGFDTSVNWGPRPQQGSSLAPFCWHRKHLETPHPQSIIAKLAKDSSLSSLESESHGGLGVLAIASTWLLLRPRAGVGNSLFSGIIPG